MNPNRRDKHPIDVLFISHFDFDHVSGVPALMARFEVQTVVLSEPTPVERVFLLQHARQVGLPGWYREFLNQPVVWLGRKGVRHVINVSRNDSATQSEVNVDDLDAVVPETPLRLPSNQAPTQNGPVRTWLVQSGAPIGVGTTNTIAWQLRSVVGPASITSTNFETELSAILGPDWRTDPATALSGVDKSGNSSARAQLQRLYKKYFKSPNESSLMLVVARHAPLLHECRWSWRRTAWRWHDDATLATSHCLRDGCVLTGDAKLSHTATRRRLMAAMRATKRNHFDTMVVPHHGSKHNISAAAVQDLVQFKPLSWIVPDTDLGRWTRGTAAAAANECGLRVNATGYRMPNRPRCTLSIFDVLWGQK